jgi:hypothetical protein
MALSRNDAEPGALEKEHGHPCLCGRQASSLRCGSPKGYPPDRQDACRPHKLEAGVPIPRAPAFCINTA